MNYPEEARRLLKTLIRQSQEAAVHRITPDHAIDQALSQLCELVRESVNEKRVLPITKEYPVFKNALEYSDHVVAIRDTTRNEVDAKWTLKENE